MSTKETLRIAIMYRLVFLARAVIELILAISGAGIAGLSLFQALKSMDKENKLDIKIYESSKLLSDIGAGIVFSSRPLQILKEIGLGDKIVTILPENVAGKG